MALIERFTPGGNLYPDGQSTFVVIVDLFRKLAENRDTRDAQLKSGAAVDATAKADAARDSAIATAASDASTKAAGARDEAVTTASSDATTKANAARDAAVADANNYTDVSFAASGPGGATDVQVDAAVERAVLAGRIGSVALTQVAPGVFELTTV